MTGPDLLDAFAHLCEFFRGAECVFGVRRCRLALAWQLVTVGFIEKGLMAHPYMANSTPEAQQEMLKAIADLIARIYPDDTTRINTGSRAIYREAGHPGPDGQGHQATRERDERATAQEHQRQQGYDQSHTFLLFQPMYALSFHIESP